MKRVAIFGILFCALMGSLLAMPMARAGQIAPAASPQQNPVPVESIQPDNIVKEGYSIPNAPPQQFIDIPQQPSKSYSVAADITAPQAPIAPVPQHQPIAPLPAPHIHETLAEAPQPVLIASPTVYPAPVARVYPQKEFESDNPISRYALFVTPGFSFSRINAQDFYQNRATLGSGINPELSLGFLIRETNEWSMEINAGTSYTFLSTNSFTDNLNNAEQFLWFANIELSYHDSELLTFVITPGFSQQLFVDRNSPNSLGAEKMTIPEIQGAIHLSLYREKDWDIGPELGMGILLPATADDSLSANTGVVYRGAISAKKNGGPNPWGFSVYVEERKQNTQITNQSTMQMGMNFSYGFNFGDALKREKP